MLQHFLARHGLPSTLVFGVRQPPFQAHCWVQSETIILNGAVEDGFDAIFIASFNADLSHVGSLARVALPPPDKDQGLLELHDEEDNFLCSMPIDVTRAAIAATYRLYARALDMGMRTGQRIAWNRLCSLIGEASAFTLASAGFGPGVDRQGGHHG